MSAENENEEILERLRALTERVDRLEAELSQFRNSTAAVSARPGSSSAAQSAPARVVREPASALHAVTRPVRSASPSLESKIGSQLFNRIGIIALLIGAAWFLKFAIDERWIGPLARVVIGVGAGLGSIAWSEWFRTHGYRAFSYSLKALGTGILYLSLWAAYALFGLMPASAAFVAMIVVTAGNAWLAWRQNSEVVAFYAAAGGFLTPLLLWTSEGREVTLFSYLLLLDLAVLALVSLRPWSRLLLAAFAGTAAYAVSWYITHYTPADLGMTAWFVVLFFLLFSTAPQLLRNLRLASKRAALTFEDQLTLVLLPLLNALLAFAELYALSSEPAIRSLRPWVAFAFAAFYFGLLLAVRALRLAGTPSRLPDTYLLLSVLAFTGAIPLAWDGRLIALSWSVESVLLFALALRFSQGMLRGLAGAVLALAFSATLSLNTALPSHAAVLMNQRFATYLTGVAACIFAARAAKTTMQSKSALDVQAEPERGWRIDGVLAIVGATILLMVGVCLEISMYWRGQHQLIASERLLDEQFSYSTWTMLFGAGMLAAGFWRKTAFLRWIGLTLLALSIAKVFLFDLRELSQGYRILSFLGLGALLLAVSFVYQRDLLGLRKSAQQDRQQDSPLPK